VIYLAALVVLATLVAMASGRVPAVLALATAICVAGVTGLAPVPALLAGLSNGGIITVAAMLVIAKGIVHTGAVTRVTWALLSTVTSAQHALRRLALPIGVGSGLMNTTPIVAMLVPAAKELEQNRGINARELLLPIAHITTLAGSVTLIGTSSNLLIAGIAAPAGIDMTMLSFAPVALPVAIVGAVIVYLTAPLMLRGQGETVAATRDWRVEIPVSGKALAIGRVAADFGIDQTQQYALDAIRRWDADLDPSARSRLATPWSSRRPRAASPPCGAARSSAWPNSASTGFRQAQAPTGRCATSRPMGVSASSRRGPAKVPARHRGAPGRDRLRDHPEQVPARRPAGCGDIREAPPG
jgi:hypothetical protein